MDQIIAIYDYHGKRSEVLLKEGVYEVNFYVGDTWKHSTSFKNHMEAVRVAEQYSQTGSPKLLID
jgi:hypothetical protein